MARKKSGSRKLTKRQLDRVQAIQKRRADRKAERGKEELETLLQEDLGPEEEGRVIAHYGLNVEVEPKGGEENRRCAVRETVQENPVCGDDVIWRRAGEEQGVITAIRERRTLLRRPGAYNRLQTVAANVDRLVVVTSAADLHMGLADRYLVAAEAAKIEPILAFNKIDLLDDPATIDHLLAPYLEMGYETLTLSSQSGAGLEALEQALKDHTAVFVGQSGVGKSSIINAWLPDQELKVAAINAETGKGRHTTTVARLYHLPGGGALIDSPGVRSFGLHGVLREEAPGLFRDIAPHLAACRFSNCRHREEPGCAVRRAVEEGRIAPQRLESLHRIVDSLPKETYS